MLSTVTNYTLICSSAIWGKGALRLCAMCEASLSENPCQHDQYVKVAFVVDGMAAARLKPLIRSRPSISCFHQAIVFD